jgi:hypothetical protein
MSKTGNAHYSDLDFLIVKLNLLVLQYRSEPFDQSAKSAGKRTP